LKIKSDTVQKYTQAKYCFHKQVKGRFDRS